MDTVTISDLLSVEDIGSTDVLPIVNGGSTKKVSIDQLGDVFTTKPYVTNKIQEAIASASGDFGFTPVVVQTLPTQNIDEHTIYLVPKQGSTGDVYDEYLYINDAWELIGSTEVDLSNYLAKNNTTSYTPSGDYNPATKKYVDDGVASIPNIQYSTMPAASSSTVNKVVQYIGTSTNDYTQGYFYIGTSTSSGGATTYGWLPINTEPNEIKTITDTTIYIANLAYGIYIIGAGNTTTYIYGVNSTSYSQLKGHAVLFVVEHPTQAKRGFLFERNMIHNIGGSNNTLVVNLLRVAQFDNTTAYTPSGDYNPATKKYVDDSIASAITDALGGSY